VTDSAPPLVVCDAGPLIHLDELDSLDLLADFPRVLVPQAVWREVELHRPAALLQCPVALERVAVDDALPVDWQVWARALVLHTGEIAALRLAQAHPGSLLLTDDTAARLAARQLNLEAHGTLGILLRSIRRHQRTRDEAMTILQTLPQRSTLHVKPDLLAEIVREVASES
jgi:predicted nucleic acid-binding protein